MKWLSKKSKIGHLLVNLVFWISDFHIFDFRVFLQNMFEKYGGEISRNK